MTFTKGKCKAMRIIICIICIIFIMIKLSFYSCIANDDDSENFEATIAMQRETINDLTQLIATLNDDIRTLHMDIENINTEISSINSARPLNQSIIVDPNDPWYIGNIQNNHIGVYLPINFIDVLRSTKNFSIALESNYVNHPNRGIYHDILIVDREADRIWSNARYNDGYAIRSDEAVHFQFTMINDEIYINAPNDIQYLRVSESIEDPYGYVENFVGQIIFEDAIVRNIVKLDDNVVTVLETGLNLSINISGHMHMVGTPNVLVRVNREELFLEIIDGLYVFFDTVRLNMAENARGDTIILEF